MSNPLFDSAAGSNASLSPDIVVVRGGFAGVMAALAAKTPRNRVLLVEPSNVLGGQGTAGGVAGFCGDTARVNDEFAAIMAKLAANGLIEPYRPNDDRRAYDLEWCAFFLQETVVARGIDVLLLSRVVAAEATEGKVERITVSTSSGLITLTPKFAIDASGACALPALTGFPLMHEGANRQLPMSLYFTLWDTGKPVKAVLPAGCPRWRHHDEIPMTSLHRFPSGKVEVKMKVVGFDAADGFSRSAAEIFARRQMHGLIHYLQTIDVSLIVFSVLGGAITGVYMMGFFTTRVGARAANIALVLSIAINVYLGLGVMKVLPEAMRLGVHSYWVGAVVNVFFVLLAYLLSLAWPNRKQEMAGLTVWTAHERAK